MSAAAAGPSLAPAQLLRLLDLAARLNATAETERLLPFIIWTAADVLGCDAASVLLYEAEEDRLRFVAATGADAAALAEIPVPLEGSLAGTIFRQNRPVRTESAETDERHFEEVGEKVQFHTRSLLGVPMRIAGEPIGVLEALNKRGGAFTDEDELLLSVIADQAAVAIRNARQVEALRGANERLGRAEEARSRFLALAAHELRTPLAVIAGYAALLRDEGPQDGAGPAAIVADAATTMGAVLDAMGEMDQLHTGAKVLSLRALPLARVLHAAHAATAEAIRAKALHFQIASPLDGVGVRGDAEQLERAFAHLLDNAVAYTPPGGTISVRVEARGGGVLVEVEDTGRGLDPEHLEGIFQEFYQVEDTLTRTHGGLGLGLPIARGIIELHGGRLWARSEGVGRGATFSVWLPGLAPLGPQRTAPYLGQVAPRPRAVVAAG